MAKNYSVYIILCLLIQLSIEVNCQKKSFDPEYQTLHTATLIDKKLYILGANRTQFFYLDVSIPFVTKDLGWYDLTTSTNIDGIAYNGTVSVKGGANNSTLFLFGGLHGGTTPMVLLRKFDTQTSL